MKLQSMQLLYGDKPALARFVAESVAPFCLSKVDLDAVADEILKIQSRLTISTKYSVSIWDADWPYRFWCFSMQYSAFNRNEDSPAGTSYVRPVLQISFMASSSRVLDPVVIIQYHLKNSLSQ